MPVYVEQEASCLRQAGNAVSTEHAKNAGCAPQCLSRQGISPSSQCEAVA